MQKKIRVFLCLFLGLILVTCCCAASADSFAYKHDPQLNPSAMADVIADPDAVYGFSPNPDSKRLGEFASYDWSDPEFVAGAKESRTEYHDSLFSLYDLMRELEAQGCGIEEIARTVSAERNAIRLASYADDPDGLAKTKASNLETYGNEEGPTADFLYEKYGSWEKVLEKAFSINSGMDACCGLYDDFYYVYVKSGQVEDDGIE